jgi:hypothetical protein
LKNKTEILLYSMPRAGGTFVKQVLDEVFDSITPTHDFEKSDRFVIAVIRDFRDVAFSLWRVSKGIYDKQGKLINKPDLGDIVGMVRTAGDKIAVLDKYRDYYGDKLKIIRYCNFYRYIEHIFLWLQLELGIVVPTQEMKRIEHKTSLEANKKISDRLVAEGKKFGEYDPVSRIHARHVYTGQPGEWRKHIPKKYQRLFTRALEAELFKWKFRK